MNKIILSGEVISEVKAGDNPELPRTWFTLKTTEYNYNTKKEIFTNTMITCFGKLATWSVQYLKNGSMIELCGKLTSYKDKEGKYHESVNAETINFISYPKKNEKE